MTVFRVEDSFLVEVVSSISQRRFLHSGDYVMVLKPETFIEGEDYICECAVLTLGGLRIITRYGFLIERARPLSPLQALALAGCPGMPEL